MVSTKRVKKNIRTKKNLKRTLRKNKTRKNKGGRISSQNNNLIGANPWGRAEVDLLRLLRIRYNGPNQHMVATDEFWENPTIRSPRFNRSFFNALTATIARGISINRIIDMMDAVLTLRDADAGRHEEVSGTHADYYTTFATVRYILNMARQSGQPLTPQMLLDMDIPGTVANTARNRIHVDFLNRYDRDSPASQPRVVGTAEAQHAEALETAFAPNAFSHGQPTAKELVHIGYVPTQTFAPAVEEINHEDLGRRGRNMGAFKEYDSDSDY